MRLLFGGGGSGARVVWRRGWTNLVNRWVTIQPDTHALEAGHQSITTVCGGGSVELFDLVQRLVMHRTALDSYIYIER